MATLTIPASCILSDDEEPTDRKETVSLYVSSETGSMTGLTGAAHECMLIKEKSQTSWNPW